MTNEQTTLLQTILLKQKKDIEDLYKIDIAIQDTENEEEDKTTDEIDLAIYSNIIDIQEKKLQQQKKQLNEIQIALTKIEKKIYGLCEESGDEISFERLKVNPTARYSIEVQTLIENGKF